MKYSQDSLLTVTLRVVCGSMLAWALIALPSGASALNTPQRPSTAIPVKSSTEHKTAARVNPRNYLAMVGPAPLRFAVKEEPLPPEPVLPTLLPTKLPPESAPKSADTPSSTPTDPATHPLPDTTTQKTPPNSTPNPDAPKPVSILPDDTKSEIRAEDVLLFFRYPGNSDTGLAVPFTTTQPRGSTAPPSSATYRQQ